MARYKGKIAKRKELSTVTYTRRKMTRTGTRGIHNAPPPGLPQPMPGSRVLTDDPKLRQRLHLDEEPKFYDKLRKTIPVHALPVRHENEVVPPFDVFALEHGTHPRVEKYLKSRKGKLGTAGGRKQEVREVRYIKNDQWAHIIQPDESACIVSAETGEIQAYVIRDFFKDKGIMETLNDTSRVHTKLAKDVRDGDIGTMCLYGYSASSRNDPTFMVSRNMERLSRASDQEKRLHNHRLMSAHTLIWHKARQVLPPEIVEPLEEEMNKEGMPRADWGNFGEPFEPIVSVNSGGRDHELTGLEMGPASGICISAYSRASHSEIAPKKAPFIVSYTTEYTPGKSGLGGNFYVQPIGLLIRARKDSLIVHRADVLHGTTVHDADFNVDEHGFNHRGFTMYCKKALPSLWLEHILSRKGGGKLRDAKGRTILSEEQVTALSPEGQRRYWSKIASRAERDEKEAEEDQDNEDRECVLDGDANFSPNKRVVGKVTVTVRKGLRNQRFKSAYSGFEDEDTSNEENELTIPTPTPHQKKQLRKSATAMESSRLRTSQLRSPTTKQTSHGKKKNQTPRPSAGGVRKGLRKQRFSGRYSGL